MKNLYLTSSRSGSTCVNQRLDRSMMLLPFSCLMLVLFISGCHLMPRQDGDPKSLPEMLSEDQLKAEVATQKRISTYFHDKVVPKLRGCWDSLQGEGLVTMDYDFVRREDEWAFQNATLFHSTLPDDQNDVALRCMQEAVRDTSFALDYLPVEARQPENAKQSEDVKRFLVSWTWPVPFPVDYEEQYKVMLMSIGGGLGGSGGCDGRGTPPKCWRCRYSSTLPSSSCCIKVCVGYTNCSYAYSKGKVVGCFNDPPTECASGGLNGLSSGGIIIY